MTTLIIRGMKEDGIGGFSFVTNIPASPWSFKEVVVDIQITSPQGESLSHKTHDIVKNIIHDLLKRKIKGEPFATLA